MTQEVCWFRLFNVQLSTTVVIPVVKEKVQIKQTKTRRVCLILISIHSGSRRVTRRPRGPERAADVVHQDLERVVPIVPRNSRHAAQQIPQVITIISVRPPELSGSNCAYHPVARVRILNTTSVLFSMYF